MWEKRLHADELLGSNTSNDPEQQTINEKLSLTFKDCSPDGR
jgi:hypothetical protein